MKPIHRPALVLAALVALASCGSENKEADRRTAVGEILPGSASDAMIHYDALRSQPPLAPRTGSAGGAAEDADDTASDTAAEAQGSEAAPASDGAPAAPAAPAEPAAE
jgi:hypothetical protein